MVLKRIIAGQIRHLIGGTGSGIAVWLTANGASLMDVEVVASAAIVIFSAAWSMYQKIKSEKKKEKENEKISTTKSAG